jgi:hypothetical protein
MNPEKVIYAVILTVIILAVSGALYPVMQTYITNITGSGYAGTAILVVLSTLYWILISAGVVIFWLKSFGIKMGGKQM